DDFRRNMDVNYYGQLVPLLILLPHFMAARKGHIANVSSMLGFMGMIGYATYAPTKFALVGLTDSLRNELKPHGITFSILYPPDTETEGF
ncbi:SDR family NAD(P)-dependent oxidoreductase, partial [Acinetobacter baumannii]